jgi:hypothetical protein
LAILTFAPDKFAAPHDDAPRNIVAMGQPVTVCSRSAFMAAR